MDANQTVVPDIVEVLSIADDSCTNTTVGYMTIKPGKPIVACVIVNDIWPFWNFKNVNMLLDKPKSLNLNLIFFLMNQAIECLL